MIKRNLLKTILQGLLIYCGLILCWGTIVHLLDAAKFTTIDSKPTWWECIYFACVSFTSIGYVDLVPKESIGKIVVVLQTMTSITFIGLFGGYIAYQFLKRPKNVLLTDNLHIRHVNGHIFFSARIGNKGKDLIDCTAYIEIMQIRNNVKWTMIKEEMTYTLVEKSWFVDIKLSSSANSDFLNCFRKFYKNPENSLIRTLIIGSDIESGEIVSVSKYYKVNDVKFGGKYLDLYHWENMSRTTPNWDNLNKTLEISEEQLQEIKTLIGDTSKDETENFVAGCSSN